MRLPDAAEAQRVPPAAEQRRAQLTPFLVETGFDPVRDDGARRDPGELAQHPPAQARRHAVHQPRAYSASASFSMLAEMSEATTRVPRAAKMPASLPVPAGRSSAVRCGTWSSRVSMARRSRRATSREGRLRHPFGDMNIWW